ncbi:MAG: hypothetical protein DLM69_04000 [Candidatus Chloroheliales bacterium]|nr:MAG: hypothetical protein DLM69_04000 [Chloroflexota bacterium]
MFKKSVVDENISDEGGRVAQQRSETVNQAPAAAATRVPGRFVSRLERLNLLQLTALVMLSSALLLLLAWQSPRPQTISVGQTDALYVSKFYNSENGPHEPFRWTQAESKITYPGVGWGQWQLSLQLATLRPSQVAQPTVELRAGEPRRTVARFIPTGSNEQTYALPMQLTADGNGDLSVIIATTPTYHSPIDGRDLGVALSSVILTQRGPVLPAPLPFVALIGSVGLLTLAFGQVISRRWAASGGLALAVLLAAIIAWQRLWLTPYGGQLLLGGLVALVATTMVRAIAARYLSRQASVSSQQLALAALLIVLFGYTIIAFGAAFAIGINQGRGVDFQAMFKAAGLLNQGNSPYNPTGLHQNSFASYYKYPPLFAGLLRPLALLDYDQALNWWRILNVGFLFAALGTLIASFSRRLPPWVAAATPATVLTAVAAPASLALLFLASIYHPMIDALNYGQLDFVILLLLTLTLAALRTNHPVLAGVLLALAAALKLYPALLILYLLWRREWRAVVGFGLGLFGWGLLGLALAGPAATATYLSQVLPLSGGTTAWVENQTLSGFVARLFTDRLALEPFPSDLQLRSLLLGLISYAGAIFGLGVTLYLAGRQQPRSSLNYALGFAATVSVSIMILPAAWLHYLVALLLPLGVSFYALQEDGANWLARAPRRTIAASALLSAGALLLAYENIWLVYDKVNYGGLWKLILSYKFYGEVLVWVGLLLLLRLSRNVPDKVTQAITPAAPRVNND